MAENAATDGTERASSGIFGAWVDSIDDVIHNKYFLIAAFAAIILLAVFLRIGMLQYQGLFEPDGFYYYSVVMQTVSNHFMVPAVDVLSGFPVHYLRGEQPGLEYLTVLPGFVLQYFGISYLTVMRLMPVLFGVLYTILAYFIAKHISNSRILGLLAMFFVAVSSGNIARTAALVYRGDSFIALSLMVALLLMLMVLDGKKSFKKKIVYSALSAFALSTGILIWTGAQYIFAVYMGALIMLIAYGFVTARKELVESNVMLSVGLLLAYGLEHLYVYLGDVRPLGALYGVESLLLYVPVLVLSIGVMFILKYKDRIEMLSSARGRIMIVLAVALVTAAIAFIPLTTYVWRSIAGTASTTNTTASPVGSTTQELQAPSYQFLFASFNYQLFFAPLAILLFLLLASRFDGKGKDHYSFLGMDLSMNSGFIVVLAYFFVTGVMQALAIRYNAIVSIPIALLSAYFVYVLYMAVKDWSISNRTIMFPLVAVIDLALLYSIYVSIWPSAVTASILLLAFGGIINVIIIALIIVYSAYALMAGKLRMRYVYIGVIAVILVFNVYNTYVASITASQADGVNPQFLAAMSWMKSNTPANSTVVAVWPDGSVVEAWANRTSLIDSVGGESGAPILGFTQFLFSTTPDTQYLYSIGRPDYLIARSFWYQELGGLAIEGEVTNASQYGFVALSTTQVTHNDTAQFYSFGSSSYRAMLVMKPQQNGTSAVNGFIGAISNSNYAQVKYVMFYNQLNYTYTVIESNATNTLNYTLMIMYTNRTINGAVILGLDLPSSNLFKFTFLCNYQVCPYDGSNVTMTPVYINGDTRILKINYN